MIESRGETPGAQDDQLGACQRFGSMPPQLERDAGCLQPGGVIDDFACFAQRHASTAAGQQLRRGHAATGTTKNHDTRAGY